jgi:hypothetical protein
VSSLQNVFVHQRSQNKPGYVLIHKFTFYCSSRTHLTYITGNYGDDVVGVCTYRGAFELWRDERIKVFVFSLDGDIKREITLPYEQLKKRLSNDTFDFKYLQIVSCEEYVFLQHNCYSKMPIYGKYKGRYLLTRGVYLYIMKPRAFSINLEHIQTFAHESLSSFMFIEKGYLEKRRDDGETPAYMIDLKMTGRRIQCDNEHNLYSIQADGYRYVVIIRYLRKGGYGHVDELVLQIPRQAENSVRSLHESLRHSCRGGHHTILGGNIYTYSSKGTICPLEYNYFSMRSGTTKFLEIISIPRPCGDTANMTRQGRLQLQMYISHLYHLFVDEQDTLVAWPKKKVPGQPFLAELFCRKGLPCGRERVYQS